MLEARDAEAGLAALLRAGCEKYVFFDTVLGQKEARLNDLPADAALRLAALVPHLESERALALCRRYHAPNAFAERLCAYLEAARTPLPQTPFEARRFVCRCFRGYEGGLLLQALRGADIAEAHALCRKVARDGTAVEVRRLAVNGRELQELLGVRPQNTARLLARLQELVCQAPESNKRTALLTAAADICERERDFCE